MHMHEIDRSKTHCGSQTSFPELENNDEQMEMKMGEQGKKRCTNDHLSSWDKYELQVMLNLYLNIGPIPDNAG